MAAMSSSPSSAAAWPAISVLGTGTMGAPIAGNLLAAGFDVAVWNRTAARAAPLAERGAQVASSPAEAAAASDVLVTMLADGEASERATSGPDGALNGLAPGSVWIQMGTVGLDWTEHLARTAAQHGVEFVDAPVSGSEGPARDGQLVVLASGPQRSRSQIAPIFEAIGRQTIWLGEAGNGTKLKLALNSWLAAQVEAAAEIIGLTNALGLDPHVFVDALADGPLGSPYSVAKANAMLAGDFQPGFSLGNAFKDVGLALAAGGRAGIGLPLIETIARRWETAIADGHAREDVGAVIKTPLSERRAS
jgi:3-hydroxyisobutyrate dehydrogenase